MVFGNLPVSHCSLLIWTVGGREGGEGREGGGGREGGREEGEGRREEEEGRRRKGTERGREGKGGREGMERGKGEMGKRRRKTGRGVGGRRKKRERVHPEAQTKGKGRKVTPSRHSHARNSGHSKPIHKHREALQYFILKKQSSCQPITFQGRMTTEWPIQLTAC